MTQKQERDETPRIADAILDSCKVQQSGLTLALWKNVVLLPLVAVSGAECVDALVLAGFSVRSRSDDATFLAKGARHVIVRVADMLCPDELITVMREAGLAYSDFLDLLSEMPTDPDVRRSAGSSRTSSLRPPST